MMRHNLYQKSGLAIMYLARTIMTNKKGGKIETISEYEKKFGFARGTIQNALTVLKDVKAISLESRGHSGTFLIDIDYKSVWKYTGLELIMGAMPLPYSKLYEGLATGLYKSAETYEVDLSMAYVRGAKTRIQMLVKGAYDFAVVSKMAAKKAIEEGFEVEIGLQFGEKSYLSEHVILFTDENKKKIEDGMVIGVDPKSFDQYYITKELCKDRKVKLTEMPYNQIVRNILSKKIDAGVWNLDEITEKDLKIPYQKIPGTAFLSESSNAVIITANKNRGVNNILREIIQPDLVLEYQQKVLNYEIDPSY